MVISVPKEPIGIRPVGVVVSNFEECSRSYDYSSESMIYMREDLTEALVGLELFSHLHVIYYQHRWKDWLRLIHWEHDELPLTLSATGEATCQGIYSNRSPARPSAMGSCVAEITKIEENRIYVRGLDALNGSPVLDIKTYIPQYDSFPSAEIPLNWGAGNRLITTSRCLHWDTINVGLTLGLRAGSLAMQELGIKRGEALEAEVTGGHFFAQGIEGATGCSILRNNMIFKEIKSASGQWLLRLVGRQSEVEIRLTDNNYSDANEVLIADENLLFASVRKKDS